MLEFWNNVKEELDYKYLSQKELAAKTQISYNTLQSWITKDRLPDAADAVKIAEALEVTVEKCRARDINIAVDGQEPFPLKLGDEIYVVMNKKKAKLVAGSAEKFYNALRSKLNWSGVPHA